MSIKYSILTVVLVSGLIPLICGSTLSINSLYSEKPNSDINLPVCYMQTANGTILNLETMCGRKSEDSVASPSTVVPSPRPTLVPSPAPFAPTFVPSPSPTP
jgi:hypothetical protein